MGRGERVRLLLVEIAAVLGASTVQLLDSGHLEEPERPRREIAALLEHADSEELRKNCRIVQAVPR